MAPEQQRRLDREEMALARGARERLAALRAQRGQYSDDTGPETQRVPQATSPA